jgi:hypothetical protein
MKPGRRNSHDAHSAATLRPAPTITPAARLIIDILHQAAHDLAAGDPGARVFVHSSDFDYYCDLIGANPGYLRRLFVRHDWLSPVASSPAGEGWERETHP